MADLYEIPLASTDELREPNVGELVYKLRWFIELYQQNDGCCLYEICLFNEHLEEVVAQIEQIDINEMPDHAERILELVDQLKDIRVAMISAEAAYQKRKK